jgi:hypothetical protein
MLLLLLLVQEGRMVDMAAQAHQAAAVTVAAAVDTLHGSLVELQRMMMMMMMRMRMRMRMRMMEAQGVHRRLMVMSVRIDQAGGGRAGGRRWRGEARVRVRVRVSRGELCCVGVQTSCRKRRS